MDELCIAAARWHLGERRDEDGDYDRVKVDLVASSGSRHPRIGVIVRPECPVERARRRLAASGAPFELYEIPAAAAAAAVHGCDTEVIVGFAPMSDAKGVCDLNFRLRSLVAWEPDFRYTLRLTPEDGLVPACLGVTALPIVAMPLCSGVTVESHGCQAIALCAFLREDVRLAVASSGFALPSSCTLGRTVPLPMSRGALDFGAPLRQLPDLDAIVEAAVREPAARTRARERHSILFQELMERAWAPERVRAGMVDLDD